MLVSAGLLSGRSRLYWFMNFQPDTKNAIKRAKSEGDPSHKDWSRIDRAILILLCLLTLAFYRHIALTNLIQNAVRYTSNGQIKIYVREDRVLVCDTGIGIDGSNLETITQPHVRGTDSNGFGLGLSIVSRLCDRFGWRFEIESEVGRGTTAQLIFGPSKN